MEDSGALVNVLRSARAVFDANNASLPQQQRDAAWRQCWDSLSQAVNSTPASTPSRSSTIPQKRSSCMAQLGSESGLKRNASASAKLSAPYLERHISAPASSLPRKNMTTSHLVVSTSPTKPIPIPQVRMENAIGHRRLSTSCTSQNTSSFAPTALGFIHENTDYPSSMWHDMSPDEYLNHLGTSKGIQMSPDFSFTASPSTGRGEWNAPDVSCLAAPVYTHEVGYSPTTPTSDCGMTTASTAMSQDMTRANTNDQMCDTLSKFSMNAAINQRQPELMQNCSRSMSQHPSFSATSSSHQFPLSPTVSPVLMKPSLSGGSTSFSVSSRSSKVVVDLAQQSKSRPLAPKKHDAVSHPQQPKPVPFVSEDGTIRPKVPIARTIMQQPLRKTTFCEFCNDQPSGFHGDHELRRHIDRHHASIRRVWICRDNSEDGTFLSNCKACRNHKTYGANYNAAAHLRRAHFNPCKNKRGGRGKKSENRGGMGGGNVPSMEYLKDWMYETFEPNTNSKAILQTMGPEVVTGAMEPEFDVESELSALAGSVPVITIDNNDFSQTHNCTSSGIYQQHHPVSQFSNQPGLFIDMTQAQHSRPMMPASFTADYSFYH